VREFLAREQVEHAFHDVRKAPVSAKDAVALVRRHSKAIAKKGARLVEIDPDTASDDELKKLFLGREGVLRAPTVSDGTTIFAGFDEAALRALSED
jgi:arsenate reductase-like glutaredoxin family protein